MNNNILIGFGSNLNGADGKTPVQNIQIAAEKMGDMGILPVSGSSIWKSSPVPVSDQPWYYNAVCSAKTHLGALELLEAVGEIERLAGRERFIRNEARTLDMDILTYNDEIIGLPDLKVPHPRMGERAFVLQPLKEINPYWVHPVSKKSLEELILALDPSQEIECTDEKIIK